MAKNLESTGRAVGAELGRAVRRLEKEAAQAARRGKQVRAEALKQSVRLLRRAAWRLNRLALRIEKVSGKKPRRRARKA